MILTDEIKMGIIKKSISTNDGWRQLAIAVNNAKDPILSEEECKKFLTIIGGDKIIALATRYEDGSEINIEVNRSHLLCITLDNFLSQV